MRYLGRVVLIKIIFTLILDENKDHNVVLFAEVWEHWKVHCIASFMVMFPLYNTDLSHDQNGIIWKWVTFNHTPYLLNPSVTHVFLLNLFLSNFTLLYVFTMHVLWCASLFFWICWLDIFACGIGIIATWCCISLSQS